MPDLLACNENWLESIDNVSFAACGSSIIDNSHIPSLTHNCFLVYPSSIYYPVYYTSPTRPVKLKLSEIEKLRVVAKKDKSLKEILQKFTSLIEIEVDF